MIGIAVMPVAAIGLSYWDTWGPLLYPSIFLFIGLTPVGFKTLNNYALEIADAADHPRYLSTLGLFCALPLLLSPALGWVVEATGFDFVFFAISGALFTGWLLTFRLYEPRNIILHDASEGIVAYDD